MKVPRVTFESATTLQGGPVYAAGGDRVLGATYGVRPMLNLGCLLGCAGNALSCLPCGTNIGCWASCAGPSAVNCIAGCL